MNHTLNCKGYLISLEHPLVMGILNITEDSFYDGGRYFGDEKKYLSRVEQLLNEGADIIDIGVMSTRPNAIELPEEEELKRVKEVISSVVKHFPKPFCRSIPGVPMLRDWLLIWVLQLSTIYRAASSTRKCFLRLPT